MERLIGSEAEDRLDRLARHPALGGPELEFLQAQLAYQRGDVSSARGLAPRLTVRSLPRQDPEQILDDTQRWALLRRCLTDETMPLDTRAAAALVLLFGLPLSRIRHLTVDQLELGGTRSFLATGRHPLLLPLRLADLLQRLADTPPTRASLANAQARQRWLFPGLTPWRPTSRSGLQLKLCAYRVDARPARNGALISLAADLPAPVLADVLACTQHRRLLGHAGQARLQQLPRCADRQRVK